MQCVVNYAAGEKGASQTTHVKARKNIHERLDLHAELYHRHKIEALRAEGERLRHELRRRGVDPTLILHQVEQTRRGAEQN